MIIPFLDGFLTFSKAPVTWILILLNVFLFSQNYTLSKECQTEFESWYEDKDFLYTQGQVYRQFNPSRDIARVKDMELLGRLAFKDHDFLTQAPEIEWSGDRVALSDWKRDVGDFMVLRAYYPPFILGMSRQQGDFFSTVSYQFFHEGFFHLLGNVLLILIVGGFIEQRYSGLTVLTLYLVGGSLAAFVFQWTVGLGGSPLIGASGSLCTLLGFLLITQLKVKTRLFYMMLPLKRYAGFVFVPTFYWVLWLCMVEDVSGYLAQPSLFSSGVAHLVHIYGFVIGMAFGYLFKHILKVTEKPPQALLADL